MARGFLIDELIEALRPLGCNLKEGTIKKFFKTDVFEDDNHPFFRKVDPGDDSRLWNCKFQLRPLDDIKRRLAHDIHLRVYEEQFAEHPDILIGFEVLDEALTGSDFPKMLKSALEPLYREQKPRFDRLIYKCEGIIAGYLADLDDLYTTPLPGWPLNKPSELSALLARGIYNADDEDRSKREWARLLGISESDVNTVLARAHIGRRAYTVKEKVGSQREIRDRAQELGAKIVRVEIDGSRQRYTKDLDITTGSLATFQPVAKHEICSDQQQFAKAPPAKPRPASIADIPRKYADNMRKPGNWHKPRWDPKFIYWELAKASRLLHGYAVRDGIGIYDPQTGEVWTNPTLHEVMQLITGDADIAEVDPG